MAHAAQHPTTQAMHAAGGWSGAKGIMGPLSLSRAQRAERDTSGRVQRDNRGSRGQPDAGTDEPKDLV